MEKTVIILIIGLLSFGSGRGQATYTWTGADLAGWNVATNWNPARIAPANNDILIFNEGGNKTVTAVPNQTIGQILLSGNTTINLQSSGASVVTISGGAGTDLEIPAGCSLNMNAANAITIALATAATASISGSMSFSSTVATGHRLIATDAGAITFNSGAVFTAGLFFSGNAFGSSVANSVIFSSGSSYVHQAGGNPFAMAAPNSVVVFQTGSLYKLITNVSPSFSGRTYADFELDNSTGASVTTTGTSSVSIDDLTITSGTLNFNMTGSPGHSIKGNISVASGGTLNFSPASAGTVNLNGISTQFISGTGTISAGANSTIATSNASGINLNAFATLKNLVVSSGSFEIASGSSLILTGTASGNVTIDRYLNAWSDLSHGWHFLSSPVAVQAIQPNFVPNPPTASEDFYKWDESINKWVNSKSAPGTWNSSFESNFTVGRGYLVAYQAAATKQFTGTVNTASVSVSGLTLSGGLNSGWHLLGNPFPSALEWDDDNWGLVNVAATAKIWVESSASYTDIHAGDHDIIPAMNGFMVQVTSAPGSLTIPSVSRVHSSTSWYKSSEEPKLLLVANDPAGSTAQNSELWFKSEATAGFDPLYDSRFLPGYAPQFYSVAGEEHLSTNTLPEAGGTVQVPFDFIKNDGTDFTIEAKSISGLNGPVYLNDLKTGASQDLTTNPVYSFTSAEGDSPARFLVTFSHVGIGDTPANKALSIYCNGNSIFVSNGSEMSGDLYVYNMVGQVVAHQKLNGEKLAKVGMNGSATGYYVVKVVTNENTGSGKVFLQ